MEATTVANSSAEKRELDVIVSRRGGGGVDATKAQASQKEGTDPKVASVAVVREGGDDAEEEDAPEVPTEILKEEFQVSRATWHIVKFAIPVSLSQITFSLVSIVGVFFAGQMGTVELGAAALSFSFLNGTAYSVAAGFAGALETLLSHSYGENKHSKKYGTYAQRMILLLLLMSFPLAAMFAYSEQLFLLAGQTAGIAKNVAAFTQVGLIGLIPFMMMEVARRYYQSSHRTFPVTVSASIGSLIINPGTMYLFSKSGFGFYSLPMAWSVLQLSTLGFLVFYAYKSNLIERTWGGWNDDALRHWSPMFRMGLMSFFMMLSEFVMVELNIMSAGFVGEADLAAFSITAQLTYLFWNVTAGFFGAMSVLVGTFIGSGLPLKARSYAFLGAFLVIIIAAFDGVLIYVFGDRLASLFSDDPAVLEAFKPVLPCAVLFHVFDAPQSNYLSIMRGMGFHGRGAVAIGMAYAVIGMPLGWFMCFYLKWGVAMLWLGPAIGCLVGGWTISWYTFIKTDWSQLKAHTDEHAPADFE